MEFLNSILITIFFVILITILLSKHKSTNTSLEKLPPGPMKLPIIGNIHNMIGPLPHHTLRHLSKKHGPLMHLKLGELSTLVVSSAEIAGELLKTNDMSFSQRPKVRLNEACPESYQGTMLFNPYGHYWRTVRKLCVVELLSHKRVQSFSSVREESVQELLSSILSSSSSINLTEKFQWLTSTIMSRVVFGRKYDRNDTDVLATKVRQVIHLLTGFELADLYPTVKILHVFSSNMAKLKKLVKEIDLVLQNIIDKHNSETRSNVGEESAVMEDLVDVLFRFQKSGSLDIPLTTDHIKDIISDMFGGGIDSAATVMEWAMAEMMKQPRVMAKAQADIRQALKGKKIIKEADIQGLSYVKLVIKETLRLHPPVPLIPRECREPCDVVGYKIPTKTQVLFNAWAIGRDPVYWQDAETFYPERFMNNSVTYNGTNFEYIPFGAGRRMCPGLTFGVSNVELALSQLLYHFNWSLPDQMKPENLDMTELFGGTVGMKINLQLMAEPYVPIEG